MKFRRIIFIVLAILSLGSLIFSISLNSRDAWKRSHTSKVVFAKSLKAIDSLLIAEEKEPQKYMQFKKAIAGLTNPEVESEYFRCLNLNNATVSEDYYIREMIERYDEDMSDLDKLRLVRLLNNLGCNLNGRNNPAGAYTVMKTGYEMAKIYDATMETWPAFLTNIANIFKTYGDVNQADKLYSEAVKMSFSPNFNPGETRKVEGPKIHTFLEYVHFLWMSGRLDSGKQHGDILNLKLPHTALEFSEYARYLQKAAKEYVAKDYSAAKKFLDSASKSVPYVHLDPISCSTCILLKAKTMYKAGNYAQMRVELDEAERLIRKYNSLALMPDLYDGFAAYSFSVGDSLEGKRIKAQNLALRDSLFSSSNYAGLRDVQAQWDKTWTDIEIDHAHKYYLWIIFSSIAFILSVSAFAFTFIAKRRAPEESKQVPDSPKDIQPGFESEAIPEAVNFPQEEEMDDDDEEDSETDEDPDGQDGETDGYDDSDGKLRALYDSICETIEKKRDIYDVDFSITTLAAEMRVNSRLISRAINIYSGKNFSSFLASYRVKEACRILDEAKTPLERPTMDALAQMVGYKSRAHLTRVFKNTIGMSPAEYMSNPDSVAIR